MNKRVRTSIIALGFAVATFIGIKLSTNKAFNELPVKQQKEILNQRSSASDSVKEASKYIVDQEFDKALKNLDLAEKIINSSSNYFPNSSIKIDEINNLKKVVSEYMHFTKYSQGTLGLDTYRVLDNRSGYDSVTGRIGTVLGHDIYNDLKNLLDLSMKTHDAKDKKAFYDLFMSEKEDVVYYLNDWLKRAKVNEQFGHNKELSFFIQVVEQLIKKYETF